ncbi:MAG: MFS transporter [Pyrinomonadaceae bacterium]|nr:MFS transporter [Pyrinomonadaceae bacterium]
MTENKQTSFFYGWIILAIGFLALIVSNGLSIGGIPVFYKWIREDFVASGTVSPTQAESFIAFGATLTFWVAGISSPFLGWLIQKFSIRFLMIVGCVLLGGGLLLHSQATSPAIVYLARTLMGISLGFVGVLPSTILVSNWFVRKRGTALGILLTGTSVGGVLIPQIANPLIERFGWRSAMIFVSLIIWVVLFPAIIFLVKNQPSDIGLFPDGDKEKIEDESKDTNSKNYGMTLAEALKTPIFWILALCSCLVFYPIFVTSQQFILYLQTPKVGLTAQQGSYALSTLFAVSVAGKFLFGFLSDRFSPTRVMLICCSVMFSATLILLSLTATTGFIFLMLFGLGYGGTFVLLQRQVGDYFGSRDYPKILGVITIVETSGAAIGGIITGKLADAASGDYTNAFYAVIVVTGIAWILVILLNLMAKKKEPL